MPDSAPIAVVTGASRGAGRGIAIALNDVLTMPGNFWEKPLGIVDMLDVGLRSSYVASYKGAADFLDTAQWRPLDASGRRGSRNSPQILYR